MPIEHSKNKIMNIYFRNEVAWTWSALAQHSINNCSKLVHPPIFLNESEVKIKGEQKHLGICARRTIGVTCYLSKYVSHDVPDQMYKL